MDIYFPSTIQFEFGLFREMYSKRKFRLVFCLEVPKNDRTAGSRLMRQRMDSEIVQKGLDFLASPPTLVIR